MNIKDNIVFVKEDTIKTYDSTIKRLEIIEKKLDLLEFYFQQIVDEEQLLALRAMMPIVDDLALKTLLDEFSRLNKLRD